MFKKAMRIGRHLVAYLLITLMIGACSNARDEVHVEISPEVYRVGAVSPHFATPIVDEAVRLNPSKVWVSACAGTPVHKVVQFKREFSARSSARMTFELFIKDCPIERSPVDQISTSNIALGMQIQNGKNKG